VKSRNHALWIGPLVTFAGLVSYFLVFVRWPALTEFPWVNLPLVLAGLGISLLGLWRAFRQSERYRGKVLGSLGFVFSLGVAGLFCFYVFYMSYLLPGESAVTRGLTAAPAVALPDQNGELVELAGLRGRKVIVTFYRGFW
jgi:hypothetical protein